MAAAVRLLVGVLGCLHCLVGGVPEARGQVDLSWKWVEGRALTYRMTEEMTLAGEGMFASAGGGATREFVIQDKVERVAGGVATVRRTFQSLRMTVDRADGTMAAYDSTKAGQEQAREHPQVKPYASMVGKSIEFDIDREGRVSRVEGYRELVADAVSATGPGARLANLATMMTSDEEYREFVESSMRAVPGREVRAGGKWTVVCRQPFAGMGIEQTTTYTLTRAETQGRSTIAQISASGTFSLKADPAVTAILGEVTMSESSCTGTVRFDASQGILTHSRMETAFQFAIKNPLGDGSLGRLRVRQQATMELVPSR
ncbi:MAG: hypothetical protein KIT24_12640 [Phycisphaeraceae bacterium]|nr:hypothetical protein [Phycisphaeraceae bacterium]